MNLFIGRLIALAGALFGILAITEALAEAEGTNLYFMITGGILLAALSLVIIISFFKKHFNGVYNDEWESPEKITHRDIEGLYPALKINKWGVEETLVETLEKAMADPEEKVIAKFVGADHHQVLSILVFSNQRVILYRTKSFGLKIVYTTIKSLIDKIPFLLWPFEGIEDAIKRVLASEERALRTTMDKADDRLLLEGGIPKWNCLYAYRYEDLKDTIQIVQIKNGGLFTRGIDFLLIPIKWSKSFNSANFTYMYRKHFPEVQAMAKIAEPFFRDKVASVEAKENKNMTIELSN